MEGSLSASAVPAPQSLQAAVPTLVFSVPTLHAAHVDVVSTIVPSYPASHRQPETIAPATPFVPELSAHAVHEVAAAAEYVSATQSVHGVDALESRSAVPGAQSVHDADPWAAY